MEPWLQDSRVSSVSFSPCGQVNLLDAMENMDQETFEFRFGEELVYTTLLSDGQMVELIPGGCNVAVCYEDRKEFIRLVQQARLEESKQQASVFSWFNPLKPTVSPALQSC